MRAAVAGLFAALALAGAFASAAQAEDDICADRPGKVTSACTVPAGHVQVEADLAFGSFQRLDGVTSDDGRFLNPTLKYGLDDATDIQINLTPFAYHREYAAGGPSRETWGLSDLTVRIKHGVYGGTDGPVQIALDPFIKAPTARRGIGNGAWEGGVVAPVLIKLGKDWQVALSPELDSLTDDQGDARHLATTQVVALTRALPHDLSLSGEVWGQWAFGPGGGPLYSADLSLAWILDHTIQLDAGVNIGLNRATPGAEVYFGASKRF